MGETALFSAEGLGKSYRVNNGLKVVFDALHLRVMPGESVSLFGPNGSGKTTLLDIVAGMTESSSGRLSRALPPSEIGYIRQDYRAALLPWFDVRRNITLPLELAGADRRAAAALAEDLADELGVALPLDSYPYQLSGGQQQLACLLRGLLPRPRLLIFDEVLSSLDYRTAVSVRERLSALMTGLRREKRAAALLVSHDVESALFLSDRMLVLSRSPMRVVAEITVPLPWPRTTEMLFSQDFLDARERALRAVCGEVS